jgi:hypothetical protein
MTWAASKRELERRCGASNITATTTLVISQARHQPVKRKGAHKTLAPIFEERHRLRHRHVPHHKTGDDEENIDRDRAPERIAQMRLAAFELAKGMPEDDGHGAKPAQILHGMKGARNRLLF